MICELFIGHEIVVGLSPAHNVDENRSSYESDQTSQQFREQLTKSRARLLPSSELDRVGWLCGA